MTSQLNPYLNFKDNAREAMEFYRSIFGGELALSTFEELHAPVDPSESNKIMHGMLRADNGIVLMAAATCLAASDVRLADAVKRRDRKAVTSLLAQKADVNGAQPDGATAWHPLHSIRC